MPSPHSRPRRRARAGAALTALGTLITLGLFGGGAAHATTPTITQTQLDAIATKITSSTSKTLSVYVSADSSADSTSDTGLNVSVATPSYSEGHSWNFTINSSDLTLDSTGAGTLQTTSTETSPYATIDLTITPNGSASQYKCGGQLVSSTQPVKVSGTFFFATKSTGKHKWGTVGSTTKTFKFSSSSNVSYDYANTASSCGNSGGEPCTYFTDWSMGSADYTTDFYGTVEKKSPGMYANKQVTLSEPAGATRDDSYNATLKSTKLTTSGKKATLTLTGNGGSTTGSATVHGTGKSSYSGTCGKHNGTKTKISEWSATFKNGKSSLEAHPQIFGPISMKNGGNGDIYKVAKS